MSELLKVRTCMLVGNRDDFIAATSVINLHSSLSLRGDSKKKRGGLG
jgi:hypothetical protein